MTHDEVERLKALLEYLDKWDTAHNAWLNWIDSEYAKRLNQYKAFRQHAEASLLESAGNLEYANGRVDNWSTAGDKAKWAFRRITDTILSSVVLKGESLFGIQGKRNTAGIYIGNVDSKLDRQAKQELLKAHGRSS